VPRTSPQVEHHLHLRLSHSRSPAPPPSRKSPLHTLADGNRLRPRPRSTPAPRPMNCPPSFLSSSTPTATFSKKSPSTTRAARRLWAQDHGRTLRRKGSTLPGCCASTRKNRRIFPSRRKQAGNNIVGARHSSSRCRFSAAANPCTTNSLDESAYALPTEDAALIALRTQAILAQRNWRRQQPLTPFAGSYAIDSLTNESRVALGYYIKKCGCDGRNVRRHRSRLRSR